MTSQTDISNIGDKLDALIRIQAALAVKDMETQKEKIIFLYSVGLKPTFIAGLLGTTPKTVSVAMSKHNKANNIKKDIDNE